LSISIKYKWLAPPPFAWYGNGKEHSMATPGELVRVVAGVLGAPEATVVQHDRNLLAAGLRSKSGRGPSAAQVTSRDAANLLIAICGASPFGASVKETVETYNRYATLQSFKHNRPGNFARVKSYLPALGLLPRGHCFPEAISGLIDSMAAGEFNLIKRRPTASVSVTLDDLGPTARIIVEVRDPDRRSIHLSYREAAAIPDLDLYMDFRQNRYFTEVTLGEIARVVGSKSVADIAAVQPGRTTADYPTARRGPARP
jgi:hypothetical protein